MEMNARLQSLVVRVRDVLGCNSVSLLLECSDSILRHPLLSALSTKDRHISLRTDDTQGEQTASLLQNERVHALYDMAIQTGLLWYNNSIPLEKPLTSDKAACSIIIAPLERPGGIIGFFLCISYQPEAFYCNRCALLTQRLPELACEVEHILKWHCEQPPILASQKVLPNANTFAETTATQTEMQEQNGFISLVSHELRVPLTAIKGYAGLLQAYATPLCTTQESGETPGILMTAEKQQHYLDVIMEQTCHMEVLVNDLLDLSKLHAGRLALRCMPVDIVHICQRVIQITQRRMSTSTPAVHTFHIQSPPSLPHVWADPDRVEQILTNLIDNAVKYSPAGGRIDVLMTWHKPTFQSLASQSREEHEHMPFMLTITVRDEGIGMSQHEQHLVSQPFVRGEHSAVKKIDGTGLGLYLARTLVEAMHGTLSLLSQPGHGTSVTFTLPLALSDVTSSTTHLTLCNSC